MGLVLLTKNNRITHNTERERIKDINELPFPDYHLLNMEKYEPILGSYRKLPEQILSLLEVVLEIANFVLNLLVIKLALSQQKILLKKLKF